MQFANRLKFLQANVFADMDRAKARAVASGQNLIDLSLGSSDLSAATHVVEAIANSLHDPSTHGYLLFSGTQAFRRAAANWYTQKFGIPVDPETEVLPLIGSQEGTAHLPLTILNPGDYALLLDPGYPSHAGGVYLAGGQIYPMPLRAENGFLPVLEEIPALVLAQSRMMVLSYPHNPTAAIAPISFFQQAVAFCQKHNLVLVHDFPYVDLVFEETMEARGARGKRAEGQGAQGEIIIQNHATLLKSGNPPTQVAPKSKIQNSPSHPSPLTPHPSPLAPSILQADSDKSVSIEFFTFSKSYNMGGFRIGFAIGNGDLIRALRQVKAAVDFNQYLGILNGAIAALTGSQTEIKTMVDTFRTRRDVFINALHRRGWQVPTPKATMYVWAKLPAPWAEDSIRFCTDLVETTGVAASPGAGFGKCGEGYVRFALVHNPEILEIAVERISQFLQST